MDMEKGRVVVGKVTRVTLFPVKSMKGHHVEEAVCSFTGLQSGELQDRQFSVASKMLDSCDYRVITAREKPKLTVIQSRLEAQHLYLTAPDMPVIEVAVPQNIAENSCLLNVMIWKQLIAAKDCGDAAARWLTQFLRKECRLVYHEPTMPKRLCNTVSTQWHKTAKPQDQVAFQDGFPYMLMTTSSLEELNTRLSNPVKIDNFRPNILVETNKAFDEDSWHDIQIGEARFRNIKPCQRCTMTTVDPETGKKNSDLQPLKTLRSYRLLDPVFENSPCFGINLVAEEEGVLRVGDPVAVTYK